MADISSHPKREHLTTDKPLRTGPSVRPNHRQKSATAGMLIPESLWKKLNRRKVVQWGIAYIAGAWGFLQGLEYVSETFHWPSQLQQVCAMSLLVGLPIVLVLSWYHGDRGHQHVTGAELTMLTVLFLIGGGLFYRFDWNEDKALVVKAVAPKAAIVEGPTTVSEMPVEYAVLVAENASLKMRLERAESRLSVLQPIGHSSLMLSSGCLSSVDKNGRPLRKSAQLTPATEGSTR